MSFLFTDEFLGAYSTEWESIYHFNVHDGRQIVLSELIDSNGVTILGLQVLGDLLAHDATFLAALADQKLDDADEFETTVGLYS